VTHRGGRVSAVVGVGEPPEAGRRRPGSACERSSSGSET